MAMFKYYLNIKYIVRLTIYKFYYIFITHCSNNTVDS